MKQFVELIIFDLDGTLVDSSADIANSVNHTLKRFGKNKIPKEKIRGFSPDGELDSTLKGCFIDNGTG